MPARSTSLKKPSARKVEKRSSTPIEAETPQPPFCPPFKPVTFFGWAGKNKRVQLWSVNSGEPIERVVAAYDPKVKRWVGSINGRARRTSGDIVPLRSDLAPLQIREGKLCRADYEAFAESHGVRRDRVVQIVGSFLSDPYQGQGIGVALYVAMAILSYRLGMAMAADACLGSTTSAQARRVWASREFRTHVDVGPSGLVGVWKANGHAGGRTRRKHRKSEAEVEAYEHGLENGRYEAENGLSVERVLSEAQTSAARLYHSQGERKAFAQGFARAALAVHGL